MLYEYEKPYAQDQKLEDDYHNLSMRVKTSLALCQKSVLFLVCPVCKHRSRREVTYEKHVKVKHERFIDPFVYEIVEK